MNEISIDEKKIFIRYFLGHFQLVRREAVWIMNYLMSNDNFIKKIHFVEDARDCPKGLSMSVYGVKKDEICLFRNSNVLTYNAEEIFKIFKNELVNNEIEDLYIQLNFLNSRTNEHYLRVLEDNPYVKLDRVDSKNCIVIAEEIIKQSQLDFQEYWWRNKIDEALDVRDKELFHLLVEEYHQHLQLHQK